MRPSVTLLTNESVNQIIEEGFALLEDPGIELHNQEAIEWRINLLGSGQGTSRQTSRWL